MRGNKQSRLVKSIVIILILLATMLSTFSILAPNYAEAVKVTEKAEKEKKEKGEATFKGSGNPAPGGGWTEMTGKEAYDMLGRPDILCCGHGIHLSSDGHIYRFHTAESKVAATAKQAFIMSFLGEETSGQSHNSPYNHAWWNTNANEGPSGGYNNAINQAANDFVKYYKKIGGPNHVKYNPKQVGTGAVEIQRKGGSSSPYISDYIKIKYVSGSTKVNGKKIKFAYISDAKLYGEVEGQGEIEIDNWGFVFSDKGDHEDNPYPSSGENFRIQVGQVGNLKSITRLEFTFKYMMVEGYYDKLEGVYGHYEDIKNDKGDIIGQDWVRDGEAQPQAYVIIGRRWYEEEHLDINFQLPVEPTPTPTPTPSTPPDVPTPTPEEPTPTPTPTPTPPPTPVLNQLPIGGKVWEDVPQDVNSKNTPDSVENGKYDEGEKGIGKVEVRVKRYLVDRNGTIIREAGLAKRLDGGTWPIYTDANGNWSAVIEDLTATEEFEQGYIKYGVEYTYNGLKYAPTKLLASGGVQGLLGATTEERKAYFNDSTAIETEAGRAAFNEKFTHIGGEKVVDKNGNSTGYSAGKDASQKTVTMDYKVEGTNGKEAKLIMEDAEGYTLDSYKLQAETTNAGLLYPLDVYTSSTFRDKTYEDDPILYRSIENMTHINLGLKIREQAELGVRKDVYSAAVVVNQRMLNYKFNEAIDFEKAENADYLNLQTRIGSREINYKLDLYSTDYYYRAAIYDENAEVKGVIADFYKALGVTDLEDELNLDVYITYKMGIYNGSQTYYAALNTLTDYYDSTFELVSVNRTKYIKEANGVEVNKESVVANSPSYQKTNKGIKEEEKGIEWKTVEEKIQGSDGKTYNKMITTGLANELIGIGDKVELYVTFRVNKAVNEEGIKNSIILGSKANVLEIGNYSIFKDENRTAAGAIDEDSAPDNVNIRELNTKDWYEDDTDSAPPILVDLYEEKTRQIIGMAWEDARTEEISGQRLGNGKYDSKEARVKNLDVTLVEKVKLEVPEGITDEETKAKLEKAAEKEYEFIWPEDYKIENTKTLKELTKFDSTRVTNNDGVYNFEGVPAGNFIVRFDYGNKDGVSTPANYNRKETDADYVRVYNGNDYKTTTYRANVEDINDEWINLDGEVPEGYSYARDDESRRLEVIGKSRELTNRNTKVLQTANTEGNHEELYRDYRMYADTPKMNIEVENLATLKDQLTGNNGQKQVGGITVNYLRVIEGLNKMNYNYTVRNINIGLEERPNSGIVLDKEIEKIQLVTNTGDTILNADYIINYKTEYNNKTGKTEVKTTVEINPETAIGINNLQALNKDEVNKAQNFRYIVYDNSIAQSLTLKVRYVITAINVGEVDRVGKELAKVSYDEVAKIEEKAKELRDKNNPTSKAVYGDYLGSTYYKGMKAKGDNEEIVTTRVNTLIDYVDNDAVFRAEENKGVNSSWRYAEMGEIEKVIDVEAIETDEAGNKYISDSRGIKYVTDTKKNAVLSVRTENENATEMTNKDFNIELLPAEYKEEGSKAAIRINIVKSLSAQIEEEDATFDNLAEIISAENKVGRRDMTAVYGNVNKKGANGEGILKEKGEFMAALEERDSSATEKITFTPPTGQTAKVELRNEIIIGAAIGIVVMAAGIILIKKKVLK